MKTIIFLLLFVPITVYTPVKAESVVEPKIEYADFYKAYSKVRKWEGNYGKLRHDRGGETYAGIARNYNKKWYGWKLLDLRRKELKLNHNERLEFLEFWATDYYLTIWMEENFSQITNQKVADYLLDYRNTGPIFYIHLQQVLKDMGYECERGLTENTLKVVNAVDPDELIQRLLKRRIQFYVGTVKNNPHQMIYLQGWINRTLDV